MPDTPDARLLELFARNGSEEAFTALVQRHIGLVHSVALRHTANPQHAEDITQAVFIILARKAGTLGPGTVLPGWLYHTARLTAANWQRSETRRIHREQEAFMQSELTESPADNLWRELSPQLDRAMAGLSTVERNALVLRYFQNKGLAEVGQSLKLSENAAQKRIARALEKLRKFFSKRGVDSTVNSIAETISTHSIQAVPATLAKSVAAAALAKGATASASTITLTKGALKIMAWTKTKTIIAGTITALLVGGVTVPEIIHVVRQALAPNITGTWEGVDAGQGRMHVVLKLVKVFGGYRATVDWPEMGKKDVPMVKVTYDYPNLAIQQNVRDIWNLKVNANATEMLWDQYINFIQPDPIRFRRTAAPTPVPAPLTENDFAPRAGSALQGYWEGKIGTGADALPVDLKIAQQDDGTFRAEGDVPALGIQGRPMIVSYQPPAVELRMADGSGSFRGQIDVSGTKMSGHYIQGNLSIPASVRRADYEAEHAHDADKDYTFTSENDLQGHWEGTWIVPIAKTRTPIRQALDIAKLPDGSYSATMANVDQFGAEAPVPTSDFEYSPPDLHMEWKWQGWMYDGTLKNGKLTGTWSQGGGGFRLVFQREN
jgi:RNA polymerase sigma factor (sigma-70 family)